MKFKIGDKVQTPDGLGVIVHVAHDAYEHPNKIKIDVAVEDSVNGYSVTDLSLPEEVVSGKPAFTVKGVTVIYTNGDNQEVAVTSHSTGLIRISSDGFTFANQAELDAIIADFKRRAQG
jgi:regulatory protein YycH of two-component signal transduction system YycFG